MFISWSDERLPAGVPVCLSAGVLECLSAGVLKDYQMECLVFIGQIDESLPARVL